MKLTNKLLLASIAFGLIAQYNYCYALGGEVKVFIQNMKGKPEANKTICFDLNKDNKCTKDDIYKTISDAQGVGVFKNIPADVIIQAPNIISTVSYKTDNSKEFKEKTVYSRILRTPKYYNYKADSASVYLNPVTTLLLDYGKEANMSIFEVKSFLSDVYNIPQHSFDEPLDVKSSSTQKSILPLEFANHLILNNEELSPCNVYNFIPVIEHYRVTLSNDNQ